MAQIHANGLYMLIVIAFDNDVPGGIFIIIPLYVKFNSLIRLWLIETIPCDIEQKLLIPFGVSYSPLNIEIN